MLWVGAGIIGALAGQGIPSSIEGLEFALVALFVVLAIDSFQNNKDYSLPLSAGAPGILAPIAAAAVTAGLHLWRRNSGLSIFGGTLLYMALVNLVA